MIKPLVKRRAWKSVAASLLIFTAGAIMSGFLVGLTLHSVAIILAPAARVAGRAVTVGILIILAAADLGILGLRTPSVNRQTRSYWWKSFGVFWGWFAWGFDLGTGFSTHRTTSLFWAALVLILLLPYSASALVIVPVYGLGLGISLLIASVILRWRDIQARFGMTLLRGQPLVRRFSSVCLLGSGAAVWFAH